MPLESLATIVLTVFTLVASVLRVTATPPLYPTASPLPFKWVPKVNVFAAADEITISAVPSKFTPFIFRAVSNLTAVSALLLPAPSLCTIVLEVLRVPYGTTE